MPDKKGHRSESSSVERDYPVRSKVSKIFKDKEIVSSDRSRSRSVERRRRRRYDDSRDRRYEREDKLRRRSLSRERYRDENRKRGNDHRSPDYNERSGDSSNKKKKLSEEIDHKKPEDLQENEGNADEIDKYWATKKSKASIKNVLDHDLMTKTGGAYIPPARLRMMQAKITDKNSVQYQRIAWEALKKSIHGLINKVTASNVIEICKELFQENIVRGR